MNRSEMRKLYEEQKLSTQVIGDMAGLNKATIAYHLHSMGVEMRGRSEARSLLSPWHDFWTEDRIKTLRRMWYDDVSARMIGNKLGCTKSAVIGKANRIGLPARNVSSQQRAAIAGQVAMHFDAQPFRHHSLISFLPDSPKLEMAFRAEVAKAHEMRQWI